eukprot:768759-Hanusia_phi.AAC.15
MLASSIARIRSSSSSPPASSPAIKGVMASLLPCDALRELGEDADRQPGMRSSWMPRHRTVARWCSPRAEPSDVTAEQECRRPG